MAALLRILMLCAVSAVLAGPCFAAHPAGIAEGFGSVSWGADVSRLPGFMKLRSDQGIEYFVNLRERYEMKGYGKPTVYYGQVGGRLYAAHLLMKDASSRDGLMAEMDKLYGPGKKSDGGVVRWKAGPVRVKLSAGQAGESKLSFYYLPVDATLPVILREAELDSQALASLLPPHEAPVMAPAGASAPKPEDYVGIDVLKFLRQGGQALKP